MEKDSMDVIHINFYSASVDDVYFPQLEVIGDIANALWQIGEKLSRSEDWDFEYFMKTKEQIDQHVDEKTDSDHFPIVPQRIVSTVRKAMPDDGILSLDNGMYKIWFARNYKAYEQNTLLLDNALATMGAGLAGAMEAKLMYPDRKAMAICGDGGFMMNSQDMETAVRLGLDMVVLILNDSGYGMIKWKQDGMNFERFALDYNNPDFVKYAESYGAIGHRVEKLEDFETILDKALNGKGVHLIDVPY